MFVCAFLHQLRNSFHLMFNINQICLMNFIFAAVFQMYLNYMFNNFSIRFIRFKKKEEIFSESIEGFKLLNFNVIYDIINEYPL